MKKNSLHLLVFAALLGGGVASVSSCSKDDNDTNTPTGPDKSQLTALIDSVNSGYNTAIEGRQVGNYRSGAKATLKTSIDLATAAKNDNTLTQTAVTTTIAALRRAVNVFKSQILVAVPAANLMAWWKFEGNANDASTNGNNGTLMSGPTGPGTAPGDGGVLPVATADRFGRPNQAYAFDNGAYIEVPYSTKLNPQAVTVSAWVKTSTTNADNYIVSMNRWQGYKFQLQGADKPFLTVATGTQATPTLTDKDAESGIVAVNTWTHVATSFTYADGVGTMKFYINGMPVKTWTGISGNLVATPEQIPLAIGQQLPKAWYNRTPASGAPLPASVTDPSTYYTYYSPAYFKGSMDDIRIYNRSLTDQEMISIFTMEEAL
jgi:hypothetical protein